VKFRRKGLRMAAEACNEEKRGGRSRGGVVDKPKWGKARPNFLFRRNEGKTLMRSQKEGGAKASRGRIGRFLLKEEAMSGPLKKERGKPFCGAPKGKEGTSKNTQSRRQTRSPQPNSPRTAGIRGGE